MYLPLSLSLYTAGSSLVSLLLREPKHTLGQPPGPAAQTPDGSPGLEPSEATV